MSATHKIDLTSLLLPLVKRIADTLPFEWTFRSDFNYKSGSEFKKALTERLKPRYNNVKDVGALYDIVCSYLDVPTPQVIMEDKVYCGNKEVNGLHSKGKIILRKGCPISTVLHELIHYISWINNRNAVDKLGMGFLHSLLHMPDDISFKPVSHLELAIHQLKDAIRMMKKQSLLGAFSEGGRGRERWEVQQWKEAQQ